MTVALQGSLSSGSTTARNNKLQLPVSIALTTSIMLLLPVRKPAIVINVMHAVSIHTLQPLT